MAHSFMMNGGGGDLGRPISVTINTLLGGAFLLEVDPLTRVSQVKDMLAQMQGVSPSMHTIRRLGCAFACVLAA